MLSVKFVLTSKGPTMVLFIEGPVNERDQQFAEFFKKWRQDLDYKSELGGDPELSFDYVLQDLRSTTAHGKGYVFIHLLPFLLGIGNLSKQLISLLENLKTLENNEHTQLITSDTKSGTPFARYSDQLISLLKTRRFQWEGIHQLSCLFKNVTFGEKLTTRQMDSYWSALSRFACDLVYQWLAEKESNLPDIVTDIAVYVPFVIFSQWNQMNTPDAMTFLRQYLEQLDSQHVLSEKRAKLSPECLCTYRVLDAIACDDFSERQKKFDLAAKTFSENWTCFQLEEILAHPYCLIKSLYRESEAIGRVRHAMEVKAGDHSSSFFSLLQQQDKNLGTSLADALLLTAGAMWTAEYEWRKILHQITHQLAGGEKTVKHVDQDSIGADSRTPTIAWRPAKTSTTVSCQVSSTEGSSQQLPKFDKEDIAQALGLPRDTFVEMVCGKEFGGRLKLEFKPGVDSQMSVLREKLYYALLKGQESVTGGVYVTSVYGKMCLSIEGSCLNKFYDLLKEAGVYALEEKSQVEQQIENCLQKIKRMEGGIKGIEGGESDGYEGANDAMALVPQHNELVSQMRLLRNKEAQLRDELVQMSQGIRSIFPPQQPVRVSHLPFFAGVFPSAEVPQVPQQSSNDMTVQVYQRGQEVKLSFIVRCQEDGDWMIFEFLNKSKADIAVGELGRQGLVVDDWERGENPSESPIIKVRKDAVKLLNNTPVMRR